MNNTLEDLKLHFELLGLSLEDWGKGSAKTFDHLAREVSKGECRINGVFRETSTIILDVLCGKQRLREARQVFRDGRVRVRSFQFGSVGDKLLPNEFPIVGLWRALREELHMDYDYHVRLKYKATAVLIEKSSSYPGLVTKNRQTRYVVKLPKHLYKPEGYIEEQDDKTTYFDWVPIAAE